MGRIRTSIGMGGGGTRTGPVGVLRAGRAKRVTGLRGGGYIRARIRLGGSYCNQHCTEWCVGTKAGPGRNHSEHTELWEGVGPGVVLGWALWEEPGPGRAKGGTKKELPGPAWAWGGVLSPFWERWGSQGHPLPGAAAEVVRLDRRLLLLHQLRQLAQLRGHKADDEQLHVSTGAGGGAHWWLCSCPDAAFLPHRLSISAVVMSYLQNPQPMSPPW